MAIKADKIILKNPEMIPHHRMAEKHRNMSDSEFEALKADIDLNGQLLPVLTYKGKLVDGRHRQRALIELGANEMKIIELPGNMTLKDVEEKVIGSENRRTDTPAQKTIRAYLWYKENLGSSTQDEAAAKFGINRTTLSLAKRVEDSLGINELNRLYKNGYLIYLNKKYTNLRSLINMMNSKKKIQSDPEPLTDSVKEVFDTIKYLRDSGDTVGLSQIMTFAKNSIANSIT